MTTEEKFNAAVNVIRSLPKNGSYQPSNVMKLKFYGYFKQATEGPCKGPRPPFWEAVSRAKYDAWKALGDMPKATAMAKYVEELHKIVETMSYTDKVANFLEAPTTELDTINLDDLELIAGDVMERVRSQPNSPLASREASPQRVHSSQSSTPSNSQSVPEDSDHSDDEYIDTIDVPEPKKQVPNGTLPSEPVMNGISKEHKSRAKTKTTHQQSEVDISREVSQAVQGLRLDIERLTHKINSLEDSYRASAVARKSHSFFGGLSPQLITFILLWPFVAAFITSRFLIRRK